MRLGKDKHNILFVVFLLLSASVEGQAVLNYKYQFDDNPGKSEIIQGNQSFIIDYDISELSLQSVTNDNGTYYRIAVPGHVSSTAPGKPELPVLSRLITIPEGFEYKVTISEIKSSTIHPSRQKIKGILYPAQEGETKNPLLKRNEFLIDKNAYSHAGVLPSDTVRIERIGILRNRRLANLMISPVHYNPKSNVLEVINSMKIEIGYTSKGSNRSKSSSPESPLIIKSLDKSAIDYNPGDVVPGYSTRPVKMVILTDTIFRKQLQPFFKWKTQKGFNIKVIYRGAGLAGTTYAQLKDTLSRIYNSSTSDDPAPVYLLIIGDVNHIPGSDETSNISDMYYGEFDGDGDYIPDMYIGRLPVADTNEVNYTVKKIIQYEKFEFADTNKFYNRALITAGNDVAYATNMNGQLNYVLGNYLKSSNNIEEHHFYYPQSTNMTVEDSIKLLFRKGVSFVNYTGHGDALGWLDPLIRSKDVDSLKNRNMYPFIITNACRTSQYSSPSSLGNKMMLSKEKGAIGFIGCSNDSYWDEDYFWAVGAGSVSLEPTYQTTGLGAYDRLFHLNGESPSDWYYTMGQVNFAGNLAVSASTSMRKKYYWETYNLVGDPSVIPIIGKPGAFTFSVPDTLPNRIKSLTLNADPFSYLAVSRSDTLWDASFASGSGSVELTLPGISNDSCLVVVTGQNKKPIIKTVHFAEVTGEYISLTSNSINDINGNNNKKADFGETFFLNLTVSNLGQASAKNLYAKISCSSALLDISKDSVYIGTLDAKSEKVLASDLEMTLSGNIPDMAIITLDLVLKDSKAEKKYKIDICVHSPDLAITNFVLNDTISGNKNNVADPGETFYLIFEVINQGSSSIEGQFHVTSNSADLSVLDPDVKSGELKLGKAISIPVKVKLAENASTGNIISLSSMLDCSPYIVNKEFNFRVGRIRESFESLSFNVFPWINVSNVPWIITKTNPYDGVASARSGQITHSGSTSLVIRTEFAKDDTLKFAYMVSSEPVYDYLSFRLNDVEIFRNSGEITWTDAAVPVTAGLNKMEWRYSKDQSVQGGADCAWIDFIDFAGASAVSYIQKDLQVARIVNPIQKETYGREMVSVRILNTGKDTVNGFNMAYTVNGLGPPVTQTFDNVQLSAGDSATVTFRTRTDMSKFGKYKIVAYTYGNNEDFLLNDTIWVDLENNKINDSIKVYPNPFTDQISLYVLSYNEDNLTITVINSAGSKVYETERSITSGMNTIILSDLNLTPAVYYIEISGTTLQRIIPAIKMKK
jgi:hypothetical protein